MRSSSNDPRLIRYALSTLGKALMWDMVELYGLFSLTALFGVAPGPAGIVFLLLFGVGAATDLIVGRMIDTRLGERATNWLMLAAAVLAGLCLIFATVPFASGSAAVGLAAAFLLRPLYSAMDVPHNALMHALPADERERLRFATARLIATTLAAFILSGLVILLLPHDEANELEAFRVLALIVGVGGALLMLLTPRFAVRPRTGTAEATFAWRLALVPAVALLIGGLGIASIGFSLWNKAIPYVAQYVLQRPEWAGLAYGAITAGRLMAVLVLAPLAARVGLFRPAIAALAACSAGAAGFGLLAGAGWPALAALALIGMGLGVLSMLSWVATAGLVDRLRRTHGWEVRSSLFGLLTSSTKVAIGIGGASLGMILAATGTLADPGNAQALPGAILLPFLAAMLVAGLVFRRWHRALTAIGDPAEARETPRTQPPN